MKVFLTGATGFIGSAVLGKLVEAGHEVTALVRGVEKARQVEQENVTALIGDVNDLMLVAAAAKVSDGVIHAATPGDDTSAKVDAGVARAVLEALAGTKKPYVHTGGIWVFGSGKFTEQSPKNPPELTAWRLPIEEQVLVAPGVRGSVVVPGVVYGQGKGIPNVITGGVRTEGESSALTMIGSGSQHWDTVYVEDIADLYVLMLEKAEAGSYYLGVSEENPTVRELSEAASRAMGLDGRVREESDEETVARLGLFGAALLLDQQSISTAARDDLGWAPHGPSLKEELRSGSYAPVG